MTQFGFIAPVYHNQERDDVAFCIFANEQFHAYKNESPYETPAIWIMMRSNSRKCIQDDEKITIVYYPICRIFNGILRWNAFFLLGT